MSWSAILGHERLTAAFRQIVARHRLAHAYLFVGPPGIGKRMFATELAKALLCERPHLAADLGPRGASPAAKLDACARCESCLLVDAGTHPDLFSIGRPEEKNEFPIDVMRAFCDRFMFKSARGHGKVAIIDDADDFNDESANCFLKTLEEPPSGSLLILLSTSLDRQLPTIKSRCHMVRFAPLADEHLRVLLAKRETVTPAMLERLLRLAGGSPGQALALADESLWQARAGFLQALAQPKIDSVALGAKLVEFAEKAGKEPAQQRRRAAQMLRLLIEAFLDALRLQAGAAARSAEPAELPLLERLAQRAEPAKIEAILERCLQTEAQVGRYIQLSLVLEGLMDALGQVLEHAGPLPARWQGFAV